MRMQLMLDIAGNYIEFAEIIKALHGLFIKSIQCLSNHIAGQILVLQKTIKLFLPFRSS